jgi:hypothetical protein
MRKEFVKDLKVKDETYCVFDDGTIYIFEVESIHENPNTHTIVFGRRSNGKTYTFDCGIYSSWICDEIGGVPIVIYFNKEDAIEALQDTIKKCNDSINMIENM